MSDEERIRVFLASAGMLMEDASAQMILESTGAAACVRTLRGLVDELRTIADAVDVILRRQQDAS